MKKKILLFTAITGLGSLAISSYHLGPARSGYDCTGAEAMGTGSFANPTGCSATGSACHNTSATTSLGVAIELDSAGVPTTHYKGGLTYTVKITGTATGTTNTHFGFQLNALKGTASATSNADAGTWAATGLPAGTQRTVPGTYTQLTCMEQSSTQTLSGGSFSESFSWTAPVTGTGSISFWGAANFVNNNTGADAGDVWNTNHVVINEWPSATTSIATIANGMTINAYPNPFTNSFNLQTDNTGTYSIQVYDFSGRNLVNEQITINGAPVSINSGNWATGLYQVVLEKDGTRQIIPVIKQ